MSVYELSIDPTGAEKGAQRIVKSFQSIQDAAGKMESSVTAKANKILQAFRQLSGVRAVSREAISQLQALSSALGSFRGPSKAAVDNTTRFLSFLRTVGRLTLPSGSSMAAFLAAMSGYRGPTSMAGKNTESLLRALSRFTPPAGVGSRIGGFLSVLSGYRGPHANAGRNTLALLNALSSFRGSPRNISAAISAFDALARSISNAATAMGGFRRAQGGNIRVPQVTGGRGAFNPRQYGQDLGFLNTAIFRTQTAFHALGGVLAAREFVMASNNIIKIKAQLEAATGSVQQARVQFGFLTEYAEKLGLEFVTLSRSYGFFLGAIKGTNVTFEEARTIFTGFTTAARALQLSTSDVDGVFRALGQIMSKGKLQAEELRGQLGDRLPGAFVRFAAALDMTKPGQLDEALKKGAISGDKLKKAIIEVAQTMEVEFAAGAEKMSKTVDAAFNRLKNAFTFTAAEAGANGLNDALISIMDALRVFIQSDALSNMLKVVAGLFKMVADNIELVTYALGTLAVAATLKWVAGMKALTVVGTAFNALSKTMVGMQIALAAGMSRTAVATMGLRQAMIALFAVMRAHPFIFIASAIVGLIALMSQFGNSNDEARKASESLSSTTADATNLYDAYIAKIYNASGALDAETQALRENTIAAIENARAKLGEVEYKVSGGRFNWSRMAFERGTFINGERAYGNAREVMGAVTRNGRYAPATNQEEFLRRIRIGGQLQNMSTTNPQAYEGYRELHQDITRDINTAIRQSRVPGGAQRLGYNAAEIAGQAYGDYNMEGGARSIISGELPEKGGGKKKGGGGVDQYEQDIRRAMEALRDLRRETKAARAEMEGYLQANADVVGIEATAKAEDRVNQIMDTFKDPATAERGLQDLNARLKNQADILDQLSPAAKAAREELIAFYAAEERANIESKKAAEVAKRIDELRFENELQKELVDVTREGGKALNQTTIELEIQKQLRGASLEDTIRLTPLLREQLKLEQDRARAMKLAQDENAARLESRNMSDTAGLYSGGFRQDEIDYYKELIELRNDLRNQGYYEHEIQGALNVRAALLNQRDAYKAIQEEYEKNKQFAQDMADAFVDGFQRAVESGENFFKSLKDIFTNLKQIIMQFVLYDPLRNWLQSVFTASAPGAGAGITAARTDVFSGGMNAGGGGSTLGGIIGGVSGLLGGNFNPPAPAGAGYNAGTVSSFNLGSAAQQSADMITSITEPITSALYDTTDIIVKSQYKNIYEPLSVLPEKTAGPQYFSRLGKIFDWKNNSKAIGDVFKGGIGKLGETLGPAMQSLGQAFALFSTGDAIGKGIGKALGLGDKGQSVMGGVLGGAAAGFSLGGPVGAAVGAVAGGLLGLFTGGQKKERQYPVAYGGVTVDQYGITRLGQVGTASSGTRQMGETAGALGARLFNQIAIEIGANLKAGNYGVFGQAAFSRSGEDEVSPFYSVTGQMNGIHPAGRLGVDYIKGTETEIQAWAILEQFRRGMITDLAPTMKAVFTNTQAKTMEDLQADIQIGKAFDEFIVSSFTMPEVTRQIKDLEDGFRKLSRQAKLLGLNETALAEARQRLLNRIRDDFNWTIQQSILEITDPRMAAYNQLVREYRDSVDEAIAVGGNLAEVERLYGLRRAELLKQTSESAFNAIRDAARELLEELTASQSSPLAGGTILSNAAGLYTGLRSELMAGNTTNADSLTTYAQNYLAAAYEQYGSSTAYFDIFRQVTEFLQEMEGYTGGAAGPGGTTELPLPELPALQDLVDEITARNEEIAALTAFNAAADLAVQQDQLLVQEQILEAITTPALGTGTIGTNPYPHTAADISPMASTISLV